MGLDWYPFFVIDYRRDTRHLTLAQDAAYRRLIDEYMLTREALPNNDAALSRIVGIPTTEWEGLAPIVRKFFKAKNDKLVHKRCERELRAQELRNKANSNRGKKAALTRWFKDKGLNARPMLTPATLHNIYTTERSSRASAKRSAEEGSTGNASPELAALMAKRAK
jgi:uncharacterized protein YdaU (DUF1376 family)